MKYKVKLCPLAKKHHKESARSFAHTFHRAKTICVTPEFYDLPQTYKLGILLHEFGHIALEGQEHTEKEADDIISIMSGVDVQRRTYRGMRNLEYIRPIEKRAAIDFLEHMLTSNGPPI